MKRHRVWFSSEEFSTKWIIEIRRTNSFSYSRQHSCRIHKLFFSTTQLSGVVIYHNTQKNHKKKDKEKNEETASKQEDNFDRDRTVPVHLAKISTSRIKVAFSGIHVVCICEHQ